MALKHGNSVFLGGTLDLLTLDDDDRAFVVDLIDRMKKYERREGGETA